MLTAKQNKNKTFTQHLQKKKKKITDTGTLAFIYLYECLLCFSFFLNFLIEFTSKAVKQGKVRANGIIANTTIQQ